MPDLPESYASESDDAMCEIDNESINNQIISGWKIIADDMVKKFDFKTRDKLKTDTLQVGKLDVYHFPLPYCWWSDGIEEPNDADVDESNIMIFTKRLQKFNRSKGVFGTIGQILNESDEFDFNSSSGVQSSLVITSNLSLHETICLMLIYFPEILFSVRNKGYNFHRSLIKIIRKAIKEGK